MTSATFDLPVPPSSGAPRGRRRGLLDALLMVVLVYSVYAKTPLGAIVETAVNVARGQKARPSWLATFKGRETAVQVSDDAVADATAAAGALPAPIVAAALAHKVDAEALASLFSVHGTCAAAACDMEAPPRTSAVLGALAGKTRITADEAARALAAGQKDLEGDVELAIEALWVGPIPVKLAVEQARRSTIEDPLDVESHADFLSPSARRGPLQGALAALAVYRLRTLSWPADARFRVTSGFGDRIHPVTGMRAFHNGTDIGTPTGTPLYSAHKGTVKRASRDSISGNYVILDHGLGLQTTYCHLSDAGVHEGARVKRRDVVGLSGATGRVTGPHLHYILRVREQVVDAEKFGESPTRRRGLEPVELPAPPPLEETKPPAPPAPKHGGKKGKREKPPAESATGSSTGSSAGSSGGESGAPSAEPAGGSPAPNVGPADPA
jgi:murein DD-endopeptidase MepM/ murein hydrolase activator NlpD